MPQETEGQKEFRRLMFEAMTAGSRKLDSIPTKTRAAVVDRILARAKCAQSPDVAAFSSVI